MHSVFVTLALGFFAIPLARPSNDQNTPMVQFVYCRTARIPFAMDAPPRKNIYTATTENADEKQLTTDGHSFNPVLSPDGTRIAYLHITADTCEHCLVPPNYEINVMNADGTEPHTLAAVDGPVMLSWSPDGRTLVYGATAARPDERGPDLYDPDTLNKMFSASHPLYLIDPNSGVNARMNILTNWDDIRLNNFRNSRRLWNSPPTACNPKPKSFRQVRRILSVQGTMIWRTTGVVMTCVWYTACGGSGVARNPDSVGSLIDS